MRRAGVEGGPSLCSFVLLQLQRDPRETVSPASPPRDCSLGSSATWWGEGPASERPSCPRGLTEAGGVWGRDLSSGLKAYGGLRSASAVSVGHRHLSTGGASQSPVHFPPRPLPDDCGGGASPPCPVSQGSSGWGFRAADPPPAVTASPQDQRRLPLPAHGPQRLPAEPKATAFEAA